MKNHKIIATFLEDAGILTFGRKDDNTFIFKKPNESKTDVTILLTENRTSRQNNSFNGTRLTYENRTTQIYIFSSALLRASEKADEIYKKLYSTTKINNNLFNIRLDSPAYVGEERNKDHVFVIDVQYNYVED